MICPDDVHDDSDRVSLHKSEIAFLHDVCTSEHVL